MAERMARRKDDDLTDPIRQSADFDKTESIVGIWGHPLHAMSVSFPIALTFVAFGADGLYWLSGDWFWAYAAVWAAGTAFLFGLLAAVSGSAELLLAPGIRIRAAAWTHALMAVLLLSLLGANWGYRLSGYETAVLPYGILLSGFNVIVVAVTGWHGGKLVFDYRLGTSKGR